MCLTGPFQFRWLKGFIYNSCYYHHHIGSINLTHCCHIFPWLCAWDVYCIMFCHLLHIHSGKTEIFFIIILQFMMSSNSRMRLGLQVVFVCMYVTSSHYHHCANLSEDIELMKCLSDTFCGVCEWDKAYSLSYPSYNIWGCVFAVYPFPLWWLRGYILVLLSSLNRKYELLPIV